MKQTKSIVIFGIGLGLAACLAHAQPQPRFSNPSGRPTGGGNSGGGGSGGGGGYMSGGERGSVVHVMSSPEVLAELNLSDEQKQRIGQMLDRVTIIEREFFDEVARMREARIERYAATEEQRSRQISETTRQLDRARTRILQLLNPAQRNQLQAFCRQAAAGQWIPRSPAPSPATGRLRHGANSDSGTRAPGRGFTTGGSHFSVGSGGRGQQVGGAPGSSYASGGGPGGVVNVISDPAIQAELQLSEKQKQELTDILNEVQQAEALLGADLGRGRTNRSQEFELRRQKEEATRQAVARAGEEILQELTPDQQRRLSEIRLQVQGIEALFKPETARALGLTATQQMKLAAMRQETNSQRRGLPSRGSTRSSRLLSPSEHEERLRAQHAIEARMISSVLTPAQQRQYEQMRGKPFAGLAHLGGASGGWGSSGGGRGSTKMDHQPPRGVPPGR